MVERIILSLVVAGLAAMLLFVIGISVYVITLETVYDEAEKAALITAISTVALTLAIAAVVYFRP